MYSKNRVSKVGCLLDKRNAEGMLWALRNGYAFSAVVDKRRLKAKLEALIDKRKSKVLSYPLQFSL